MNRLVTLQAYHSGEWQKAAELELLEPERGSMGACRLEYDISYFADHAERRDDPGRFRPRLSSRHPVQLDLSRFERWPAFLDDIRPAGAAERWWTRRLGLEREDAPGRETELLSHATIAPIGHLRIAEALPEKDQEPARFERSAVIARSYDFLEHAAEYGGAVGGATGAGGEAPKLLLRVTDEDQVWIDTWQDQPHSVDSHYLVKFARNQRDERDQLILRAEFVYYQALATLGIETANVDGISLEEGHEPSLWLPRFDVERRDGLEHRHGMESLYALIDAPPGSYQSHWTYLDALHSLWEEQGSYDREALTFEYVRRDLLNLVLGNSDNHGRNTALLRTHSGLRLAPVFDLAPMKLDASGIIRSTRWGKLERGGQIDWPGVLDRLDQYCDGPVVAERLRAFAKELTSLHQLLSDLGLPQPVLTSPLLSLKDTATKLARWRLL